MANKFSGWIRQSRYRARKHGCVSRLVLNDVMAIFADFQNRCAYCDEKATTVDQPFLACDGAPNVAANCLPCCRSCKAKKKNINLIAFLTDGHLQKKVFTRLVRYLMKQDGNAELREHMIRITGMAVN